MTKLKFILNPDTTNVLNVDTMEQTEGNSYSKFKNREINNLEKFEFVLILINRFLIGFVTVYVTWISLRAEIIPWHAVFCTIGLLFLMPEGLVAHYRGNAWTRLCYRAEKTRLHWIFQITAIILGLVGVIIKYSIEPKHFYTLHGQLGLVALVLCLISALTGLSALYANNVSKFIRPTANKVFHIVLGLITFALVMASFYTAFDTNIFYEHSLDARNYLDFVILLKTAIVLILLLSSLGPLCGLIYSKIWH